MAVDGIAKDNLVNLFGGSQGQTSNGETCGSSAHTNLNDASSNSLVDMMATPDNISHTSITPPQPHKFTGGHPN